MAQVIRDCEAVLCGGMGSGIYEGVQQLGIRPVLTRLTSIDEAVQACAAGRLVNQTELLH